jgi:uncharacterized SAM-binding protein YcdF (DUF218 family)
MDVELHKWLLLGAAVALGLWLPLTRRAARLVFTAALALLTVASVPIVPYQLLEAVAPYRPFVAATLPDAHAIVLLGAAITTVLGRENDMRVLTPVAATRVLEAARVYHLLNNRAPIISSGGVSRPGRARQASAIAMRDALVELGIPADHIIVETESLSTHDEAVVVAPMLRRLGAERFVLVTSHSHMPRSERTFRAQGLDPVPAPAPDFPPDFPDSAQVRRYRPDYEGLRLSGALLHEGGGLLYYAWRGWLK